MSDLGFYLFDHNKMVVPEIGQINRSGKHMDFDSYEKLIKDANVDGKPSLNITINATHSGTIVNRRVYPGRYMERATKTWVRPYSRPVLSRHPNHGGMFGGGDVEEPSVFGRVDKAEYVRLVNDQAGFANDWKTPQVGGTGSGFNRLFATITDEEAINKILSERLFTVSTGQFTNKMTCSICGIDWHQDRCDHRPGQYYDIDEEQAHDHKTSPGKYLCYHITGGLKYDHVAFVNTPAQPYASVVAVSHDNQVVDTVESIAGDQDMNYYVESMVLHDRQGAILLDFVEGSQARVQDGKTNRVAAVITEITDDGDPGIESPANKRPGPNTGVVTTVAVADAQEVASPMIKKETRSMEIDRNKIAMALVLKSLVDASLEVDQDNFEMNTGLVIDELIEFANKLDKETVKDDEGIMKVLDGEDEAIFAGANKTFPAKDPDFAAASRRVLPYVKIDKLEVLESIRTMEGRKPKAAPAKDVTVVTDKVVALEASIADRDAAYSALMDEYTGLQRKHKKLLADRIFTMQVKLEKKHVKALDEAGRKKYIDDIAKRELASLEDTINDLSEELGVTTKALSRTDDKIEDPTLQEDALESGSKPDAKDEDKGKTQKVLDSEKELDPMVQLINRR